VHDVTIRHAKNGRTELLPLRSVDRPVASIAIVTDCVSRRRALEASLSDTQVALSWHGSLAAVSGESCPALVLLERALLRSPGLEMLLLRQRLRDVEIAVIGARSESDIAFLLDAGADDAMVGHSRACTARLNALARRARARRTGDRGAFGDLVLDRSRRRASVGDLRLALSPTEWAILECLLAHHPAIVTPASINASVWSDALDDHRRRLIRVHLSALRTKLRASRSVRIVTRRGSGYGIRVLRD
jgi:DNA-binding response OmpR family regulator